MTTATFALVFKPHRSPLAGNDGTALEKFLVQAARRYGLRQPEGQRYIAVRQAPRAKLAFDSGKQMLKFGQGF